VSGQDTESIWSSRLLAELLGLDGSQGKPWQGFELGAMLRHQLTAPIEIDLGSLDETITNKLRALAAAEGLLIRSFGDLLRHPNPPRELLVIIKHYAKAHLASPESSMPPQIMEVLYLASIAAGLVRLGERITSLTDTEIHQGCRWALKQPWMEEGTKELLKECDASLERHTPEDT